MTNQEKALKVSGLKERPDYEERYYNPTGCRIYDTAMEMAKWKDGLFEKVIEYTEICYGVFCFNEREKFIENIKKLYRGEKL